MTVELERLSSLAAAIEAAEQELAAAHRTFRRTAAALLRCGEATVVEVSEASGLDQGELLDLPELVLPPNHRRKRPGNGPCTCGHWRREATRGGGSRTGPQTH